MKIQKKFPLIALASLTIIMLVPSAFANGCNGDLITKEIIDTCEFNSDPTSGLSLYTPYQWYVKITVTNNLGETMMDVYLKDRFGGEFAVGLVDSSEGLSLDILTTKGKTAKVFLDWEYGDLMPGETIWVLLLVSTDENPGGNQEFTSCGCYYLNSGATVQWKGGSASTGTLVVTTY